MAKQTIGVGASANDGTGDTVRDAFSKVNANTDELYVSKALADSAVQPTLVTDIVPDADGTRDLGSSTNRFGKLHVDSIDLKGTTMDGTTLADPGADRIIFWDDSASTTTWLTPGAGVTISGTDLKANLATAEAAQLTAGFSATDYDAGTQSTGTYTPDPANGNFQIITNGGAFTLAPPTNSCAIVLHVTNSATAGAITTTGFTAQTGSLFTTTDLHEFICHITKIGSSSILHVTALQ